METLEDKIEAVEPVEEEVLATHSHKPPEQEQAIVRVPGDARVGGSDEMLTILAMIQSGQIPLTDGVENALVARMFPAPPPMPSAQARDKQDLLAVALVLGAGLLSLCLAGILIAKIGDSSRDRGYQTSINNLVEQNSKLAKENRSSCIGIFITCPAPSSSPVELEPPIEVPTVPTAPAYTNRGAAMAATLEEQDIEPQLSEEDLRFYRQSYHYWQTLRAKRASVKQMRSALKRVKSRYPVRQRELMTQSLVDFVTTL